MKEGQGVAGRAGGDDAGKRGEIIVIGLFDAFGKFQCLGFVTTFEILEELIRI